MSLHDKTIIALTGHKFCGKSTAGKVLINDFGYVRIRFADKLKAMLYKLGLTIAQVEGDEKEVPCDLLLGKTPRYAMQTLGTEWGRGMIGGNIWVAATFAAMSRIDKKLIVIDDCRFLNEAKAVSEVGGHIVRIVRPGYGEGDGHASETEMDGIIVDHTIVAIEIEELRAAVREYAKTLSKDETLVAQEGC